MEKARECLELIEEIRACVEECLEKPRDILDQSRLKRLTIHLDRTEEVLREILRSLAEPLPPR